MIIYTLLDNGRPRYVGMTTGLEAAVWSLAQSPTRLGEVLRSGAEGWTVSTSHITDVAHAARRVAILIHILGTLEDEGGFNQWKPLNDGVKAELKRLREDAAQRRRRLAA